MFLGMFSLIHFVHTVYCFPRKTWIYPSHQPNEFVFSYNGDRCDPGKPINREK